LWILRPDDDRHEQLRRDDVRARDQPARREDEPKGEEEHAVRVLVLRVRAGGALEEQEPDGDRREEHDLPHGDRARVRTGLRRTAKVNDSAGNRASPRSATEIAGSDSAPASSGDARNTTNPRAAAPPPIRVDHRRTNA